MAEISASLVKELREMTGLGMMECKKALTETNGDIKAAADLMRVKSGAKAVKAAGRIAAEGLIGVAVAPDAKVGAIVEVNCETDFVAKNEDFSAFVNAVAQQVVQNNPATIEALSALETNGETLEKQRQELIMKLGENLSIRRFERIETQGKAVTYVHSGRIGVLVDITATEPQLGKDVAMHIAATKPSCVSSAEVPAEAIENEKAIYRAQAAESGKPADIIEKMIVGRVQKFLAEVSLLGQPFVKNADQTVEQLLNAQKATVHSFKLFTVGEGIEKKQNDFAAEVMAQIAMA
ncbi:MAG: translation elongation factor Ts [Pseudomonadota bacterium]